MQNLINNSYEHRLQSIYYDIGNRGIRVDTLRIAEAQAIVKAEIARQLAVASAQWNSYVYVGAENNPDEDPTVSGKKAINLNATQGKYALLKGLTDLGYEVPKITKKTEEGNYESDYSTGELALQKMLSKNQFSYPGGDPAIKAILKVRELGKLKSSYLDARLFSRNRGYFFLSKYNVAGTLTGRRSSCRHTFGFGNNAQNFPKHSDVAGMYRRCLVPREGNIFLMVDQISAEDWPVSALSENRTSLTELRAGNVDRHTKLASMLFNVPLFSKTPEAWKASMERYMGKKTRHASNYDMKASRMTDALAQEGFSFSEAQCKILLDRMAAIDPNVKNVFHKYVQDSISKTRTLITPLGRERQFLGARPNDHNSSIFKEAYAFVPQSVVGDNTGLAILDLESQENSLVVQEGHDSIVQDIPANIETIYKYLLRAVKAFDRKIVFHNGIEIEIPIEAEIAFDFQTAVKIKTFTREGIKIALDKLQEKTQLTSKELVIV